MKKASYYQILEIDRNATKPEIKAAFRRKAKLLHPDTNPSQDAQEEFV
ncbi:MAG: DnaJ domain-containing protein [Salibacteraceae bacterium]